MILLLVTGCVGVFFMAWLVLYMHDIAELWQKGTDAKWAAIALRIEIAAAQDVP